MTAMGNILNVSNPKNTDKVRSYGSLGSIIFSYKTQDQCMET